MAEYILVDIEQVISAYKVSASLARYLREWGNWYQLPPCLRVEADDA